jgi:serine/threonine protein kinase
MGEIFLAKSGEIQGFEKLFVIKKILPQLSNNPEFTRRFVDEAKITIKLNHVNIVPVFEVGVVGTDYFLALEYLEGRDLRRVLSRCYECHDAVPPDLALLIARDMANGLSYAHRKTDESGDPLHVVHCDISPPNVLISVAGEVKIIDFGVARSADQISRNDPAVGFGKFGYMAPEQILKGRELDHRTDLYAAGVVLFEMLVGDRMIDFDEGEDFRDIARRIVLGDVPVPSSRRSGIPRAVDDLVRRAIAKAPEDRFQSGAEMRDQIQRVLAEINPTASADDLAAFIRRHFEAELQQERDMIREIRSTDLSRYQPQLTDAKEHTVSYAMTDAWAITTTAYGAVPAAEDLTVPPPALASAPPPVPTEPEAPPRRALPLAWIAAGLAAILILVVVLMVAWPRGDRSPSGPDRRDDGLAARSAVDAAAPAVMAPPVSDAAIAAPRDALAGRDGMNLPPPMRPDEPRRPPPGDGMIPPRRDPMEAMEAMDPMDPMDPMADPGMTPEVDEALKAAVLAKFRRVQGQYAAYKSQNGLRLESHWNKILQTAVYSGADRYKRLNALLDDLVARMARSPAPEP